VGPGQIACDRISSGIRGPGTDAEDPPKAIVHACPVPTARSGAHAAERCFSPAWHFSHLTLAPAYATARTVSRPYRRLSEIHG
jgi:hypothetical protein